MNPESLSAPVPDPCGLEKEEAIRRRMAQVCTETLERLRDPGCDPRFLAEGFEAEATTIAGLRPGAKSVELSALMPQAFDFLTEMNRESNCPNPEKPGLSTGFFSLDEVLCGMRNGELLLVTSLPSDGKTTLALNLALNLARRKSDPVPVAFFTNEGDASLLALRLLCIESKSNLCDIRKLSAAEFQEVGDAAERLKHMPIHIVDLSGLTLAELREGARHLYHQHGVRCFFFDELSGLRQNRTAIDGDTGIARMLLGLKSLAVELNVPVVLTASLEETKRNFRAEPRLRHLSDLGIPIKAVDVVMMLRRKPFRDLMASDIRHGVDVWVYVLKNRHGWNGLCNLLFLPIQGRFEDRLNRGE